MKTSTLRGLGSSLLLNVGLAKVAAKVDPVASLQTGKGTAVNGTTNFPCARANGSTNWPCLAPQA